MATVPAMGTPAAPFSKAALRPPLAFAYFNNPKHENVVGDARVRAMPTPLVLARRLARRDGPDTYLRFEVFDSLDHASAWIQRVPPEERCYLVVVDHARPVEMFFDAEIQPQQLAQMNVAELTFDRQMIMLTLWMRCMVEALSGVAMQQRNAWLWRADRHDKFSCHGHFPHCVFEGTDVQASYMRVFEDVLYAHRASMMAAQVLHFRDVTRMVRRRPASVSNSDGVMADKEDEMVCDFGVYSSVRQMRLALNRSAPHKDNKLTLWQPVGVHVREDVAQQSPVDIAAATPPKSITAGDALRLTLITAPDAATGRIKRAPLTMTDEWARTVDTMAAAIGSYAVKTASTTTTLHNMWDSLITYTWSVYVDASTPPRFATRMDLAAQLDALMTSTQPPHDGTTRATVVRWRFVWWCALALRWRCPTGHVGVAVLDGDALVADIRAHFVELVHYTNAVGRPHMVADALAVLRFVASHHNVALYARIAMDDFEYSDRGNVSLAQMHNGAMTPADIWQVVTAVFPLEVATHLLLEPEHRDATTSLDSFNTAIDTLASFQAQPNQVITMLIRALQRGPVWRAPAAFLAQRLAAAGAHGRTRYGRNTATPPSVAALPTAATTPSTATVELGTLQDLSDQTIGRLLHTLPHDSDPFYVRQSLPLQSGWRIHCT